MASLTFAFTLLAALGCGLMAGLFFAFSVSVMAALAQRPPAEGMAAMQAINVAIVNPVFGVAFFGTLVLCVAGAALALSRWHEPGAAYLLIGCALYIVGGFALTILVNVPLNSALAEAMPDNPQSVQLWADYLSRWTAWNHVRTAACLAALAALILASVRQAQAAPHGV